jgi:hypothetical protein
VTDGEKMEGSCSTGQSPQRAVVPVEEEEDECACTNTCNPSYNVHVIKYEQVNVSKVRRRCPCTCHEDVLGS